MADMGARVIKIEGRGGDAWRKTSASNAQTGPDEIPLFDLFNVGKESLSLNLKTKEGKAIFFKLLDGADLLITNTRQQFAGEAGGGLCSLKEQYPA